MNPTAAQLHKNAISPLFTICYTFHVLLKTTLTAESRFMEMLQTAPKRLEEIELANLAFRLGV
jgi:hypothetical protein